MVRHVLGHLSDFVAKVDSRELRIEKVKWSMKQTREQNVSGEVYPWTSNFVLLCVRTVKYISSSVALICWCYAVENF